MRTPICRDVPGGWTGDLRPSVNSFSAIWPRFMPVSALFPPARRLRYEVPIRVHLQHCIRGAEEERPCKGLAWRGAACETLACRGSYSASRSFTLSASHNEVNDMALQSKLRSAGRLTPPGPAPGPVLLSTGCHAPPPQSTFSARFPIGPRFWAASCTPTSIAFSRFRPNWGLSKKCSLLTSDRESTYACFSFAATHLTCHLQNSISCTPPVHRGASGFPSFPQGAARRPGGAGEGLEDPPPRPVAAASIQPHFVCSHSLADSLESLNREEPKR